MLNLAYRQLTQESADVCEIGSVSETGGAGYLWHYWIPWMAMLDRKRFRLCQAGQAQAEGRPFAFPLELRWEFVEWARRSAGADFLTPHVPLGVLTAVRTGKAVILLYFGHEGRPLNYVVSGQKQSAYDLILNFHRRHDLPRGAVWFVSGNLTGWSEYESWKRQRLGPGNAPDPFEARFVEPFSFLAQAAQRIQEQGVELEVESKGNTNARGAYQQQGIRLTLSRTARSAVGLESEPPLAAGSPPTKLFLCMNRRPHQHRRSIVCHLLRRGHLERSLVSFRDDNPEAIRWDDVELAVAWQKLQRRQPLTIDRDLPLDPDRYFLDNPAAVKIGEAWPYRDTCYSIITETHFTNDRLFVSEKLWKPIVNRHPFLVAGTPGTLAYLHSLGFRTFTPAINEHYDSLSDDRQRMQALFAAIDALGALDDAGRDFMLRQMGPTLAHNEYHLRHFQPPMARLFDEIEVKLMSSR
jgi:hypothetical protein